MQHADRQPAQATGITAVQGPDRRRRVVLGLGPRDAGDRLRRRHDVEGELSALAYDRGFTNDQGTAFQSRPALYAAQQFAGGLQAFGREVPESRRSPPAGRRAGATAARVGPVPAAVDADPADEHAVGQLPRGEPAEGHRRPASEAPARPPPARRSSGRALSKFGINPRLNDGSGPLALRPDHPDAGRHACSRRWPPTPRSSTRSR